MAKKKNASSSKKGSADDGVRTGQRRRGRVPGQRRRRRVPERRNGRRLRERRTVGRLLRRQARRDGERLGFRSRRREHDDLLEAHHEERREDVEARAVPVVGTGVPYVAQHLVRAGLGDRDGQSDTHALSFEPKTGKITKVKRFVYGFGTRASLTSRKHL